MLQTVFIYSTLFFVLPFLISLAISIFKKGRAAFEWTPGQIKGSATNIALSLVNILVAPAIYLLNDGARQAYDALGIPYIPMETWAGLPFIFILLVSLIAQDFADYWNHRLLHAPGMWAIHAVHHSDPDMNHTTALRLHILESFVMTASYTVILSWLGLPPEAAAGLALFRSLYNKFVHIDVDIHLGPLVKWIATPRYHQWHHANDPRAFNTNFANVFAFWDVLFGTYYVPGPCNVPLGFDGSPNHNLAKLFFWPFLEWGKTFKSVFQPSRKEALTP